MSSAAVIRAGVIGAAGRMGTEVCRALSADPGIDLVAAVDPRREGTSLEDAAGIDSALAISGDLSALKQAGAEVAVDFTTPSSVVSNVGWCIDNLIHVVVGTTGISSLEIERLSERSLEAGCSVLIAPNFAIGAVLMMRFAGMAARWLPDAEIVELHHQGKLDSPSGTSLRTAGAIAEGSAAPSFGKARHPGSSEEVSAARGAEAGGVRIHSVRLPGLVAHQEVIFGGQGQTLSIRHDSLDRSSFMPGVLLAVRKVRDHPGLTVGLEHLLELD